MNTLLSAQDYFSPETYAREQTAVFGRTWHFVGYQYQLAAPDDWITADVGGVAIFVQNCAGELRGFLNVCSHRFSRLREGEAGRGCIQCPYHGWRYNHDGVPVVIPAKPRFDDLSAARLKELRLRQVAVEVVGGFVFVCLGEPAAPLRQHLGGLAETMISVGAAMGPQIASHRIEIAANWKFVVENTLEGYHLSWVHGETFDKLGMAFPEFDLGGAYAASYARVSSEALAGFAKLNARFAARPYRNEGYFHAVLFPNFGLATLYGMTFSVQRFLPLGPERTLLQLDMFGTRVAGELGKLDEALLKQFFTTAVDFSRKVCAEDQGIVELQQKGVRVRQQNGILSDEETRIGAFQREYARMMA